MNFMYNTVSNYRRLIQMNSIATFAEAYLNMLLLEDRIKLDITGEMKIFKSVNKIHTKALIGQKKLNILIKLKFSNL